MCIFSKYSDILGKQNTGVHKYKIGGTSIVDYILNFPELKKICLFLWYLDL